jgi:DNA polymerase-3 subunit beta
MPKFIISAAAFAKALAQVTPVVASNSVVPILENVLLSIVGATLTLRCSNLESDLTVSWPVETAEAFAAAVPAKKLLALLRTLPDAPLTCTWNAYSYAFTLSVGKSKYKLAGENPHDYPRGRAAQSEAVTLTLPANVLRAALTATVGFVSTDDNRPAMTGVYAEFTADSVHLTGTDGHRLALWSRPTDNAEGITWTDTGTFIMPRGALALLAGLLDAKSEAPVTLLFDATNVRLSDERWVTRLVDERYPDYRNVIPQNNPNVAMVDRDELLSAVRRLEELANKTTKQIRLGFAGNEITASAEDLDFSSEGSEVLGCDYDGEDMEIGFNARFLRESLGLLPAGQVRLEMSTTNRAGLFSSADEPATATGLRYLVMPVQLNQYV